METIAAIAVGLVAALHLCILALEMFFWTKPLGRRAFGVKPDFAKTTAAIAANQGLYNGFLAAGLIWGLILGPAGFSIRVFFLACVIVAGVFGTFTASRKILWVQAVPGILALVLTLLAGRP